MYACHVWMKTRKGVEMQLPKADSVQLTVGRKGFLFMYPEDDPRENTPTKEKKTDEK